MALCLFPALWSEGTLLEAVEADDEIGDAESVDEREPLEVRDDVGAS